jgi:hypothetical protein
MKGDDVNRIQQATAQLSQAATRMGETTGGGAAGPDAGSQQEPGVVDADFEEVDKRDRKTG